MNLDDPNTVLCPGGDVEAVKETKTGDDANYISSTISSSFTPINHHPTQLPTPRSSTTAPIQQNQARRRAAAGSRRQRNPAVAQYLGLESTGQSAPLHANASPSTGPENSLPKLVRKRVSGADRRSVSSRETPNGTKQDAQTQTKVSESFRVAKPTRKSAAVRSKEAGNEASQPMVSCATRSHAIVSSGKSFDELHLDQPVTQTEIVSYPTSDSGHMLGQEADAVTLPMDPVDLKVLGPETDLVDTNFLAQFDDWPSEGETEPQFPDEDFEGGLSDSDFLMLTSAMNKQASNPVDDAYHLPVQVSIPADLHGHDPEAGSSVQSAIDLEQELRIPDSQSSSKNFTSPVTLTTRLLATTSDLKTRKAIVRPPFPAPVRDRSPIIGLSSNTLLRTCFRIGEAINQSCQASRSGKRIIIELFARVLESERTDTKQHFTFCDLFHAKPPYLKATYEAAIWKSVQLFEYDGRRLLEQGRICRCIGTIKREANEWKMTVLNAWEATWEDVNWVEGIVDS